MAQFDVHRSRDNDALLLDCQSDLLNHLETRLVIPLMPDRTARELPCLHPLFEIDGRSLILATQLAAAVDIAELGPCIASLSERRYEILNALDMLLTGV
jgi:toxin CcdB